MSPLPVQIFYTLEETLLFSLVTVGLYLSFRLLRFPDLTAEGGFGFAGILSALVLVKTGSPLWGVCAGTAGGAFCGLVTALLANLTKLPTILASILTMTMSISTGLLIAGKPSITLPDEWIFKPFMRLLNGTPWLELEGWTLWMGQMDPEGKLRGTLFFFLDPESGACIPISRVITAVLGGFLILSIVGALLLLFYRTGMGFLLRTRGDNPRLLRELNRSLLAWDVVGLCLANSLVGFAAALFSQSSGYASINMGRGVAIGGLAAIMLGECLFVSQTMTQALVGCFIGTLVLRLVRLFALNFGMPDGTLDLVTSLMVVIFYYLAKGRSGRGDGILENIRV